MATYKYNDTSNNIGFTAQEVTGVEYQFHTPEKPNAISLVMSGQDEMLRITEDGFYVRGQRVPVDDQEAKTVYLAFKQWLAWAQLQRQ